MRDGVKGDSVTGVGSVGIGDLEDQMLQGERCQGGVSVKKHRVRRSQLKGEVPQRCT